MGLKHLVPLCALLLACQREQWDDCITSTGPIRAEERMVGDFHAIDLDDRVDLVMEARAMGSVSVEAGSNLLAQIVTETDNGTLKVRNGMRCNWVRSFKPRVTVHVPVGQVARLTVRGTGNVSCVDTIVRAHFELEQWSAQGSTVLLLNTGTCSIALHTGAGDVTAKGSCAGEANLFSGMQGAIDAGGLRAQWVNVNNSGTADIRCWATGGLYAAIHDVGNVYYRGAPASVHAEITGSGSLIHE